MANYQCLNPDCNHTWPSDDEPFECPNCHGQNFQKTGSKFPKWLKWVGMAVVVIVVFTNILKSCDDGTKVTTNQEIEKQKLTVILEGDHSKEYKVTIKKDGIVHGEFKHKETNTFTNLYGTYTLDIKYIGKGDLPKINAFQRTVTFPTTEEIETSTEIIHTPEIISINKNPDKLSKSVKDYTITIITDTNLVPLDQTEFSKDGNKWQSSNKFKNIPAGTHTFYARHKKDESLVSSSSIEFDPYTPGPLPTDTELNTLLNKISSQDDTAFDAFISKLGGTTKVYGAAHIADVNALATDAFVQGNIYKIVKIENNNNVITSITVTKQ